MFKISRRQFIAFAVAGGGIAAASHLWSKRSNSQVNWTQQDSNQTQVYRSQNGLLEVNLEANYTAVNIGGQTAYLLAYNGQIPAPRLEAKAGDRVRIKFTNQLQQPTNLHYHGLHLPPTGKADNVFLKINPRESFNYEFEISQNQPAGTFWYHPHLHGYTADQVSGGLAGLFVIGQAYNSQRIDTQVKLNTVEEWELINTGVMDHPFHVHVNSFQVISRNGQNEPYLAWQDTVLVRSGETVKIRIPFRDFTGKTVYHCHILDHEDLGMMGNLEIMS